MSEQTQTVRAFVESGHVKQVDWYHDDGSCRVKVGVAETPAYRSSVAVDEIRFDSEQTTADKKKVSVRISEQTPLAIIEMGEKTVAVANTHELPQTIAELESEYATDENVDLSQLSHITNTAEPSNP